MLLFECPDKQMAPHAAPILKTVVPAQAGIHAEQSEVMNNVPPRRAGYSSSASFDNASAGLAYSAGSLLLRVNAAPTYARMKVLCV
jgi:hypothetical protein